MIHFANPLFLYALLVIPVLIIIYIFTQISKKKSLERFGDNHVISSLMPLVSKRRGGFKFAIILAVLLLVIISIARPQFGSKLREVTTEGVEIVIALDVSNSMLAEDIKPSRLDAAKRSISKMLDNLDNDKIGLIVFAGNAYTQVPVTTDYTATKMLLSTLSTNIVQEQGTAIGEAIELAMRSYSPDNETNKALIIITDGENHEDNPVEIAREAHDKGIVIYTIGLGDTKGTPIPLPGTSNYRKDNNGNVIMTKLNESMLIEIANAAEGKYIRANNMRIGLKALYEEIEKLDKMEMESVVYDEYEDVFQYLIFLAILLLVLDYVILNRKNKQLEKFKIFNLRS
jgi:Ca-activated chloride channel family protein